MLPVAVEAAVSQEEAVCERYHAGIDIEEVASIYDFRRPRSSGQAWSQPQCRQMFGPIKSCYLPKSKQTGECKGYGFISFDDARDAKEAHDEMKGATIHGKSEANKRVIKVDFDAGKKKKEDAGFLKTKEEIDREKEGRRSRSPAPREAPREERRRRSRSRSRSRSKSNSPAGGE